MIFWKEMEKKKSPGTSKSCFHICLYWVLVNFSVEIKNLNKKKNICFGLCGSKVLDSSVTTL